MHHLILLALGGEKINVEKAGYAYDLMSKIETNGTTHCSELVKNDSYNEAVVAWVVAKKAHRQRIIESKTI